MASFLYFMGTFTNFHRYLSQVIKIWNRFSLQPGKILFGKMVTQLEREKERKKGKFKCQIRTQSTFELRINEEKFFLSEIWAYIF